VIGNGNVKEREVIFRKLQFEIADTKNENLGIEML